MPVVNGNYVAAAWSDGQAPAINDDELGAMSHTLENCQILKGSGAPTQYTAGTVGQLYIDESTEPKTIWQCRVSASEANVWVVSGDPNTNLAEGYDASGTYAQGAYCIRGGLLYRARYAITEPEAWTPSHWQRAWLAEDLAAHAGNKANPHNVTKGQVGLGNVDNIRQYSPENPPFAVGEVTLSASWSGASSPYYQTVTVTGATVTASSKVDLQPTAAQISSLGSGGTSGLLIENSNGTLTAWALGTAPASSVTLQCTVTEVG